MCCSPNTVEPSVAEGSGDTSQEEPVVLGVQRCQKEMRTPRYATEPCILCQEQQEVREARTRDMLRDKSNHVYWFMNRLTFLVVFIDILLVIVSFFMTGQQWWTRHRYGFFRPAVDRVVPFPREDVRKRWRAGPDIHPRGPVLGSSRQQLWSHDA